MKFPEGILRKNFSLKNITSFQVGGKCDFYFIPDSLSALIQTIDICYKEKISYYIIGNGSNILFSDNGFKGVIINLKGFSNYIELTDKGIKCGASAHLHTVVEFAKTYGLTGIENLAGIPGTIGGALIMNAGAFGTEIGDIVDSVTVLTTKQKIKKLRCNEIKFSYRKATPLNRYLILETELRLKKGNKRKIAASINKILKLREKKQPLEFPSAGSTFKRPENNYAGTLIEKSGLKGYSVGGAKVSEKHANFIINTGSATASDIYNLIKYIQKKVYKDSGIKLQPEIKLIGFN